jgi:hypothetical protein
MGAGVITLTGAGAGAGEDDTVTLGAGAGAGKEELPALPDPASPPPQPTAATATNRPCIQGALTRILTAFINFELHTPRKASTTSLQRLSRGRTPRFQPTPRPCNVNLVRNRNRGCGGICRKASGNTGKRETVAVVQAQFRHRHRLTIAHNFTRVASSQGHAWVAHHPLAQSQDLSFDQGFHQGIAPQVDAGKRPPQGLPNAAHESGVAHPQVQSR